MKLTITIIDTAIEHKIMPLIKARICWHMLIYAHICVEKCKLFFHEPILAPGAISKLGEVFPLPQALFLGSKMAFLNFVTCIRLGEVFPAAAGAFFFCKNDVPGIFIP